MALTLHCQALEVFTPPPQDHPLIQTDSKTSPVAINANYLPIIGDLLRYLHAAAGFPVKFTWLTGIKSGNFNSWPGLSYSNASKYCPVSVESTQFHLTQARKGLFYTKPKTPSDTPLPTIKSQELLIQVEPIRKLYTDDMGRFPLHSCSGNHYIMLAFHVATNVIFVEPFYSKQNRHCLATYNRTMTRLKKCGHTTDLKIIYNKSSKAYRINI